MDTHTTRPSWLTIVLGLVTIVTFFMAGSASYPGVPVYFERMGIGYTSYGVTSNAVPPSAPSAKMMPGSQGMAEDASMMAPDYYQNNPDVTDTREFLKIFYNAQMKTRDVPGLSRRVETTIKGYEGRIDSQSLAEKSAYLSFVVPQAKYDQFRDELESLVGSRFLDVAINSENRLGQKQSIEEQAANASSTLAQYQSQRSSLVASHASRLAALQAELGRATATSTIDSLKRQIAEENASYSSKLASIDASITYAKDWQAAVAKGDQSFMKDIETVQGTVSIAWVSLWDIAQLYLPGYSIPAIFALLTGLSYWRDRRRTPQRVP